MIDTILILLMSVHRGFSLLSDRHALSSGSRTCYSLRRLGSVRTRKHPLINNYLVCKSNASSVHPVKEKKQKGVSRERGVDVCSGGTSSPPARPATHREAATCFTSLAPLYSLSCCGGGPGRSVRTTNPSLAAALIDFPFPFLIAIIIVSYPGGDIVSLTSPCLRPYSSASTSSAP
jgi:hypothetical protein